MDIERKILHLGNFKLDKFNKKEYAFFLTKATEEELEMLQLHKKEKRLHELKEQFKDIDLNEIYLIGNGHSSTARYKVGSIMDKFFTHKCGDLHLHFRDYERSLENQKGLCHLINICPDAEMSWYSALRKIGYHVYSVNSELGRIFKERNEKLTCNIIIWKQPIIN